MNESQIIQWLKNRYNPLSNSELLGDDCAFLTDAGKEKQVISVDSLVEGTHFKKSTPPHLIAKKLINVTLSDLAATAAYPKEVLLSLALNQKPDQLWLELFYGAVDEALKPFDVKLLGGDLVRSRQMVLTSIGIGHAKTLISRKGASSGDIIAVTGQFGGSFESEHHLNFKPRIHEALWLAEHFELKSLTDASDGLYRSIELFCIDNALGALIDKKKVPLRSGASFQSALFDGEDFELVFCCKSMDQDVISKFEKKFNTEISVIGVVDSSKKIMAKIDEAAYEIQGEQFEHFK